MTGRLRATLLAVGLLLVVVLAVAAEQAQASRAREAQQVVNAITAEFGDGPLGACFWRIAWRESTLDPRKANRSDPNGGSYGALQINGVWRRHGETVDHFARRMFDPAANARLAHRIYHLLGFQPWGGRCA
jgi:hypothetical protein